MEKQPVRRRLAAILAADVAGYTRLMELDTDGTVAAWQAAQQNIIKPIVADHGGKIVKLTGDGFLVEFSTVQDAVDCAIAMQQGLTSSSLNFRMGINLGDIVDDGEDIHGEGVNVAARIEGLAQPGGICISGDVYNQVRNRVKARLEDMGPQNLTNVSHPIQVYAVHFDNMPSPDTPDAAAISGKPSIAVLPFNNLSGDPDQEYFSDGITDDIITALSRFHWFFVIARNSSFTYKGRAVDVKQVGRELGVQYVLEGSVRKSGDRVRITAQLIDAEAGHHIRAERYDRNLEDVFAVQDEISEAIATTVAPAFLAAETKRAERKAPESLDAWDYAMRGNWHLSKRGKDDTAEAISLFEHALSIDPGSTLALSGLAFALCWVNLFGWKDDLPAVREKAHDTARRAVELDDDDALAHTILGWARFSSRNLDGAIAECQRALECNPSLALAQSILAIALSWRGDHEEAVRHAKMAERLSPRERAQSMWSFARTAAEFGRANYDEAIEWARITIESMPAFPGVWRYLAASLGHLGRNDEAGDAIGKLLAVSPHDNLRLVSSVFPADRPERLEQFVGGLRKAGLPE